MEIKIKKLHSEAKIPRYAHVTDAGMDAYGLERIIIQPMERVQIKTGIALEIPTGTVALIWDKSGLSHSKGLKVLGGVIDSGYRGEVLVGVVNLGFEEVIFEAGDKVAQILIQKIEHPNLVEVTELGDADRGDNGFGSTGVK